ncbi:non-oxidative hydroxyarylic acid decarboxylases subunit D [Enterobacter mori]|uniref:non-oxidative hydroxyarylic acid decarboxylases subunit D n=3 Tax=Enterobacteriaceae TaxID=543 RepID=UPI003CFE44BB
MICPRCADEHIEVMATSPVKGVWTVYQCQHCLYTWRDTEPLRRTSREHYPEAFRMTQKDIDEAPQVPTIPPPDKTDRRELNQTFQPINPLQRLTRRQ